ncbi:MAG: hypothetical protein QOC82_439 [Frankiaceae bacterium]|nr:hypothetical protein [Frankiaceae bacterium]
MSLSKGLGAWALTPVGGLIVVTVAAITATGGLFLTGAAKADFSVAASPASQSAAQGQSALFTVTLSANNGFASPVQLTASGLPTGATASFSPVQLTKGSGTSSMSVTTANDTPTGTSTITVTGTSGSLVHGTTVSLTVTPHVAPAFSLSATPGSSTMLPGDTATYQVSVAGTNGFSGSVALSTVGALPAGMVASFSPAAVTSGHTSTLTVTTKNNTTSGNYTLTVAGNSAGQQQQTTTVGLNLNATGRSFTITGPSFSNIAPGVNIPLDLAISNPNTQALNVTNLTVTVQSVTKAAGIDPSLKCTTADYVVTQYGGTYPLTVGPGANSVKLSALDNIAAHLPTIGMLNSSTANQDGCRGANVVLAFTGAGQGG